MKNTVYKYYHLEWQDVLNGYSLGIFPMGDDDGSISWYETSPRAILPIERERDVIHVPRSLLQVIKKNTFEIRIDTAFDRVLAFCAERETTWINRLIMDAYTGLFERGYAHSIETWRDGRLAGGLYGVAYKGAFFGESMFYLQSNASKAAVIKLFEILKANKYILLDIQMMTDHFRTFGAIDVSKNNYHKMLERAMSAEREFIY